MAVSKKHIRDIRLSNNAGMSVPVCVAAKEEPLNTRFRGSVVADAKDATCEVCRKQYPVQYPWARKIEKKA